MWHQVLVATIGVICLASSGESLATTETRTHNWFSLPIEVRGLSEDATGTPVSMDIDFSRLLADAGVDGTVDTKSLRLFSLSENGGTCEVTVQFSAAPLPRLKERPFLPGTPTTVSSLGEYRPKEVPTELRTAGRLTWIASKPSNGICHYRLDFGVLRNGRFVQVPYPPQDLKAFDPAGRATPVHGFPRMQIRPQWPLAGSLDILENHELVTRYHIGPTGEPQPMFRRPFLYPVHGPDGIALTEFGKPHDPTGSHAHHYSIWIAHAGVAGQDFWSERRGGIIAHDSLPLLEDGAVFCRLVQTTRWLTAPAGGEDLLHEKRTLTFYRAEPDFRIIDVELEFTPPGAQPVTLGQTNFGFLAVRIAQSMTVFDGGGEIRNAAGDLNEREVHTKQATWIDQSGPVGEDRWAGVAIFDHPDNPRHPTYWHCRNDGWAGAAFNLNEAYAIEPGQPLRLRYRLCLHRHDALRGRVAERYAEYAAKPEVHVASITPKE
jgi:hypothetical protein